MPQPTDTYGRAYEACDHVLFEDGRFPTIDAIRARIHVNSPATIKRAINDWTLHFVERHRQRLQQPALPALLADAAEALWQLALGQADQALAEQRQALAGRESAWRNERQALETQRAEGARAWEQARAQWREQLDVRESRLTQLAAERDAQAAREGALQQALNAAQQALAQSEGVLAEARAQHEANRRDWTEKFELDHRWHLRRIEEEKQAARLVCAQERAAQARDLASVRQENQALRARLGEYKIRLNELIQRNNPAEPARGSGRGRPGEADAPRAGAKTLLGQRLQQRRSARLKR